MARIGLKKMTQAEMVNLADSLRAHCAVDPNRKGFCLYEEGWDDERVAKEAGERFTLHHVRHLRQALLGHVVRGAMTASSSEIISELRDSLRRQAAIVDALVTWASKRPVQPFRREP